MKLIHCADFHLGAPLNTHFSPETAALRRQELLYSFQRMVDYANSNGVSAVLITGDLFDSSEAIPSLRRQILQCMETHPSISFFYLRGNHDRALRWGEALPANLFCFGPDWTSFACGEVMIHGIEPGNEDAWYDRIPCPAQSCNIVMLHGQIASSAGPDQIVLPRLSGRHIDYLALGHVHQFRRGSLDSRGIWAYAGCPEGRGFDETGEKGFVLLEVIRQQVNVQFIPFAKRTIHQIELDITGLSTFAQQQQQLMQQLCKIPSTDAISLTLTGTISVENSLDPIFFRHLLEERFFMAHVSDRTRLAIDRERYASECSLKGAFFRTVTQTELSDRDRDFILRAGFAALDGEPISI